MNKAQMADLILADRDSIEVADEVIA